MGPLSFAPKNLCRSCGLLIHCWCPIADAGAGVECCWKPGGRPGASKQTPQPWKPSWEPSWEPEIHICGCSWGWSWGSGRETSWEPKIHIREGCAHCRRPQEKIRGEVSGDAQTTMLKPGSRFIFTFWAPVSARKTLSRIPLSVKNTFGDPWNLPKMALSCHLCKTIPFTSIFGGPS